MTVESSPDKNNKLQLPLFFKYGWTKNCHNFHALVYILNELPVVHDANLRRTLEGEDYLEVTFMYA